MIGKIIVLGAGGLALAYLGARAGLFEDTARGRKARQQLGEQFRRVPLPHLQLVLPVTRDDLDGLDDAMCECAIGIGAAAGMTDQELLALGPEIQTCTASLLFPEVEWPPVHSDNPTVHQYWAILDQRLRRLVFSGELAQFCGAGADAPPPPTVTAIDPRSVVTGTKPLVRLEGSFGPQTVVAFRREDGRFLATAIHERTLQSMQIVVDADEPGTYDLIVQNGPNPASSASYQGALVVQNQSQQE